MFLTLANSQRTHSHLSPFHPGPCEPPGIMAEVGYMDTAFMFWVAAYATFDVSAVPRPRECPKQKAETQGFPHRCYPLVICYRAIENGPVEIVDFPINSMVIVHSYVSLPEGTLIRQSISHSLSPRDSPRRMADHDLFWEREAWTWAFSPCSSVEENEFLGDFYKESMALIHRSNRNMVPFLSFLPIVGFSRSRSVFSCGCYSYQLYAWGKKK